MTKTLIAKWKRGQDPAIDRPAEIRWSDGTPGTLTDYGRHLTGSSTSTHKDDGSLVIVMHPGLTAVVRFDHSICRWVCHAPNRRVILELSDPDVADYQLIAQLYTYEIFYQPVIIRATIG
jgi:hypothetical protein